MARKSGVRRHLLIYAGITPFVVIAVFPVVWMAITAFKQDADLYRMDVVPFLFHLTPTLEHFERLFTQTYFSAQLLNTLRPRGVRRNDHDGGGGAGRLRARALAITRRRESRHRDLRDLSRPADRPVDPAGAGGGRALGLFDSWWAAWVDGCGRVSAIWRVVLPASRPGLAISAIFAFSLSMQGYLYAVVYVAPRAEKVVTVGLTTALIRGDIFYWGSLMAGALLVGLPVALLYNFVLDHFIQGLTGAGAP